MVAHRRACARIGRGFRQPHARMTTPDAPRDRLARVLRAQQAGNDGALNFFGLTAADLPAAVVHDTTSGDKKYARPSVDAAGVEALIAAFNAGELKPTVKSEAVPEDNTAPVTVLVAKNFDDIVAAPGKTILLEFYAPVRPVRAPLRLCTLWPCALQGGAFT